MTAWTEEHKLILAEMEGVDSVIVAERLGRSVNTVRVRRAQLAKLASETADEVAHRLDAERHRKREMRRRARLGIEYKRTARHAAEVIDIIPAAIIERDKRINAPHRDLTASILGDPPVGFSALEKYQRDLVSA